MGIGANIKKYRLKVGLTQKDLADKLHFTYQAISRWENDEAEPSIDAMKEMCVIFGCSLDELLNGEKVIENKEEIVKTEETITPVVNTNPVGKCHKCGKDLFNDSEYKEITLTNRVRHGRRFTTTTNNVLMCNECIAADEEEKKVKKETEVKRKKISLSKRFKHAIIWPTITLIGFLVGMIVCFTQKNNFGGITCLIFGILFFTFIASMILDNTFLTEMWLEVTSWGFVTLPGIIVEFSIDGFILLIVMKVILWALGIAIAIGAALLATFVCMVLSVFVYPVALIRAKNDL